MCHMENHVRLYEISTILKYASEFITNHPIYFGTTGVRNEQIGIYDVSIIIMYYERGSKFFCTMVFKKEDGSIICVYM